MVDTSLPIEIVTDSLVYACNNWLLRFIVTPVPCINTNGSLKILAIYIPTN